MMIDEYFFVEVNKKERDYFFESGVTDQFLKINKYINNMTYINKT